MVYAIWCRFSLTKDSNDLQCVVGCLAAGEGIADLVPVGHVHPAGLLQVEVLGGQVGEHAGHDVGGQDGFHGDVVGHQADLLPPGAFHGRGRCAIVLFLGHRFVHTGGLCRHRGRRRRWRWLMVHRVFGELGIAQAAVLG